MIEARTISELPRVPAVYVMIGGRGAAQYAAYVGVAGELRSRVRQHFVRRNSSVTTRTSAVALLPEYVTELRWWDHSSFKERHVLEAAEVIAFGVLEPALRSRGRTQERSLALQADQQFVEEMKTLFSGEPTGVLALMTIDEAMNRIHLLEDQVTNLVERMAKIEERLARSD